MRRQWIGGVVLIAIASAGALVVVDFERHSGKAWNESVPPPLDRPVAFSTDVAPILRSHCARCHGPETDRGGLRLDTHESLLRGGASGPVIVPGRGDTSLLIRHVLGLDGVPIMPPPKSAPLDREQVRILRTWIDLGAPP